MAGRLPLNALNEFLGICKNELPATGGDELAELGKELGEVGDELGEIGEGEGDGLGIDWLGLG